MRGTESSSVSASLAALYLVPLIVILDVWSKWVIRRWIGPGADVHRHEVLDRALAFEYVENRGAAFGMFHQGTGALILISVVIIGAGIIAFWKTMGHDRLTSIAIAIALGGAIGNLLDRVFRGYVVDFIAVGRWPKFNLADSSITIGMVLLLVAMFREEQTRE